MANTLTAAKVDKLFATAILAFRENAQTPREVNVDFKNAISQKGDVISFTKSGALTVSNVSPSNVATSGQDSTPTNVTLTLDQWKKAEFYLTDKEMEEINSDAGVIPLQVSEAMKVLANTIDAKVLGEYTNVAEAVGTAGTTPFASDTSLVSSSKRRLATNLAPQSDRKMFIDEYAQENVEQLAAFRDISQSGDSAIIREGVMGRKFAYDWFMNQNIPTHTHGTLTGTTGDNDALINNASVNIGDTTVALDDTSLTGTIVEGDIFTVAGDTQTYVSTGTVTAAANAIASLAFYPAAKVAWADNAVLTIKTDHVVNLAFQKGAFALAIRPLGNGGTTGGNIIRTVVDSVTGIPFRLEISRQNKQTLFEFDVLYGTTTVNRDHACRIMG